MDPSLTENSITIEDPKVNKPPLKGVIYKGNIYLNLLNIPPGDYSKELFILFLDKAEEAGYKNLVVCLNRPDGVRPFGFLGFKMLPPGHPLIPKQDPEDEKTKSSGIIYMGYSLE